MYEAVRRRLRLRCTLPVLCVAGLGLATSLTSCSVGGEICSIKGTASFTPGLAATQRAVSYTFTGNLALCQSTLGDSTIHTATVTASGSGPMVGCTGGATTGTATLAWNNGQTSTLAFTTSGALNAVVVTGRITAGEFAGHAVHSVLAFTVANPAACNTPAGVTTATFSGATTPA
jgi:hypothetical protein